MNRYRREFLGDVGRGMLVAGVGASLAQDLGLVSHAFADGSAKRLTFGEMEPLVTVMEETPTGMLLPVLVDRINDGADLRSLVTAAALANARTFGGQDYDGYHALMALAPALQMANELPASERALPVLKVLYRNTFHIQNVGGRAHEALHPIEASSASDARPAADALRDASRARDMDRAERVFAGLMQGKPEDAYNELLHVVQDHANVHRVVLAWRSWALLDLTGRENAHALLRQSVRYCVDEENDLHRRFPEHPLRALLPKLMDQYKFASRAPGDRHPDDAFVASLSQTIYGSTPQQAAEAVAGALADGFAPEAIGEAISLAANQLVLHDPGRQQQDTPAKPKGSVHGASVGVHASDAANAWRNIARVSNHRNTFASLIVGAYHTAGQSGGKTAEAYPFAEHREKVRDVKPDALLHEAETAIKAKEQSRACALVHRHGELGGARARLRPHAPLRHQRGRRPPRREILPNRD